MKYSAINAPKEIKIIVTLIILLMSSCGPQNDKPIMGISPVEETLLREMALHGNKEAYNKLNGFYFVNVRFNDAYFISQIIADKYQNKEAYFTLFWCLLNSGEYGDRQDMLDALDPHSRFLCLFYLLKAQECGSPESESECNIFFKNYKKLPSSNNYLDSLKYYK